MIKLETKRRNNIDNIMPKKKWEFNNDVAKCFDDMLERSIPNYETMRELVYNIGRNFIKGNDEIIDIGCSNGNAALPFIREFDNPVILCDVSEPMLDLCRREFADCNNVQILNHDLRRGLPDANACLILSILTIQFTPIEYRHKIINDIYKKLDNDGCFIFVEKVLGDNYTLDKVFTDEYYNMKREHQYTNEQIQAKRESLEGVLVPVTENWNLELLKRAGFEVVECFWRYLNFVGWIAIKE